MHLRPRVSVLAMMVLVAVVAVVLGAIIGPQRAQNRAVAELRRRFEIIEFEPSWLGRRTGLAFFQDATWVIPGNGHATAADMKLLRSLPRLRKLDVSDMTGEMLAALDGMGQIEVLDISGTGLTDEDLPHLESLTGLRELGLWETGITDEGLVHLARLKRLRVLHFQLNGGPRLKWEGITEPGLARLAPLQ